MQIPEAPELQGWDRKKQRLLRKFMFLGQVAWKGQALLLDLHVSNQAVIL